MGVEIVGKIVRRCDKCGNVRECSVIKGRSSNTFLICGDCQEKLDISSLSEESFAEDCMNVANSMIEYGGSFEQGLGRALMAADRINAAKIRRTWPEYWEKYLGSERVNEEGKGK